MQEDFYQGIIQMSSPDADVETMTFTELRREVELAKRNLTRAVRNAREYYEKWLTMTRRLDHFHENKLCPTCNKPGCGDHCNTCGREILFIFKGKVLVDKTSGKQCILNLDGSEHMLCYLAKPFGIPDLDDELNLEYKQKHLARIEGTRVWMDASAYYTKRNP